MDLDSDVIDSLSRGMLHLAKTIFELVHKTKRVLTINSDKNEYSDKNGTQKSLNATVSCLPSLYKIFLEQRQWHQICPLVLYVSFLATRALAVNATYQPDIDCANFEKKCRSNEP